jgi:hypothetical protein
MYLGLGKGFLERLDTMLGCLETVLDLVKCTDGTVKALMML